MELGARLEELGYWMMIDDSNSSFRHPDPR